MTLTKQIKPFLTKFAKLTPDGNRTSSTSNKTTPPRPTIVTQVSRETTDDR